jgi:hypothetical protein
MAQKDTLDNVAYTCMLSYPIHVSHLSFNFLCLGVYLCGEYLPLILYQCYKKSRL